MISQKQINRLKPWLCVLPAFALASVLCHAADTNKSTSAIDGGATSGAGQELINPYEFTDPTITNCLFLFKKLEPLPEQLTGVALRLKQAGAYS